MLTLHGALMVPQMLTMREPTQRNISTYHISQSKKIIFRYFLYILGKKLSSLDLKVHYKCNWALKKGPLLVAPLLPLFFHGFRRTVMGNLKSPLPSGEEKGMESGERE